MTAFSQRITSFQHHQYTFEVIDSGPLDGQPVVLLHGFPETAQSWDKVSHLLNQNNYRTFAIQQRGYSPKASPTGRYEYRTSELVEDVHTFIKSLEQPVYLISHDWGAIIAIELAKKHSHLIKHLTLISVPHTGAFVKACLSSNQLIKSYYMGLFQIPFLPEILFKKFTSFRYSMLKNAGMTNEQLEIFNHDFIQQDRISTAINWYRGLLFSPPLNIFQKIAIPTLFIWGQKDIALTRKSAELNKEFFTGAYVEHFIDATHWIPHQNADLVAEYFISSIQQCDAQGYF